mmetsp:Transcript_43355/g.80629  ORF Transcript_43355/g.80629 Transcript_43355/m.80629 type:complete len:231 (+) Transcript_43355:1425-2117(+)
MGLHDDPGMVPERIHGEVHLADVPDESVPAVPRAAGLQPRSRLPRGRVDLPPADLRGLPERSGPDAARRGQHMQRRTAAAGGRRFHERTPGPDLDPVRLGRTHPLPPPLRAGIARGIPRPDPRPLPLHVRLSRGALWRIPGVGHQARVRREGLRFHHPGPRRHDGPHGLSVPDGALYVGALQYVRGDRDGVGAQDDIPVQADEGGGAGGILGENHGAVVVGGGEQQGTVA